MTLEEMIEQLENTILLIKQNGKDWLDERDIPILEEAIKAIKKKFNIMDLLAEEREKKEEVEQRTAILNDVNNVLRKYGLTIGLYNFEGEGGFIELYLDKVIGK